MKTKINIAEILKDKPQGIKLYADAFGELSIEEICTEDVLGITLLDKEGDELYFYNDGKYSSHGEPILVPSKSMRDWRKFAWKKGDILLSKDNDVYIIFEKFEDDAYTRFKGKHYLWKECNVEDYNKEETKMLTSVFEKAADDVAQTYIKTIEEHLDGKLNLETLEIEKQLEFKDGDIVVYGKSVAICRKIYKHTLSFYVSLNEMFGLLFADEVESSEEYRFATEEEKQQLFSALAKKGKAWDAEEKQIVDLKPKLTPKPFDKIVAFEELGRKEWVCDMFSHYSKDGKGREVIVGIGGLAYSKAVPFNEKTAKLIGTTKEWKG